MSTAAKSNPAKASGQPTPGDGPVMDEGRITVCLEAAWEIDALARLLPSLLTRDDDDLAEFLQVRGVAARLRSISTVLMSACADEQETTESLRQRLGLHLEG